MRRQSIMAEYRQGLLHPLEPLTLQDKQRVRIQLELEPQTDAVKKPVSEMIIEERGGR